MLSSEFFKMLESRGCATVQIPVTSPVVIRTTKTQPGTSPRSDFAAAVKVFFKLLSLKSLFNFATTALLFNRLIDSRRRILVLKNRRISIEFKLIGAFSINFVNRR
jgi:hypothetical protein